ncbi:MAG: hypothetical protein GWN07_35510, partial [Actinobacteria bacterium]|nr:C2H2-type zinc finger protein [Actinomycetota bacterium]NIW32624.1 hypothetical protein [Actinomycetota bacterium]NIX24829.1 hypothetical protein [Actinomycetota bacterium]
DESDDGTGEDAVEDAEPAEEHVCAECGRAFASQQGLAGHSRVHK